MKQPSGLINQKIEIYSDQDAPNTSGGVDPVLALYWATSAKVEQLSAGREIQANQEFIKPTIRFTIRDRIDKNVLPDMQVKYRNSMFIITSAIPDIVYNQDLVITAVSISTPSRVIIAPSTIEWGYSSTDYHDNEANITQLAFSQAITTGVSSVALNFTPNADGQYLIFRVPTGFNPTFTKWNLNPTNGDDIPGFNWYGKVTAAGYDYYLSRQIFYLNDGETTITFSNV